MISAPPRAPNQNGMMERSFRNSEIAIHAITTDQSTNPGQDVLTMACIARNHVPHSATGIPPALEMTGRADLLDGAASTIFDHNPSSGDVVIKQANGMRNILNARNDVVEATAKIALETCIDRQLPDRSRALYPIGSTVQIADRGKWTGSYRVVAHASSNLIIERGTQLSKWPKVKCRRIISQNEVQLDAISDVDTQPDEPREIAIRPDPMIIDDAYQNIRDRATADVPPDQSDDEYWIEEVNQCSTGPSKPCPQWTGEFGALITSNFCVGETPELIDHSYLHPTMITDAIPIPSEFAFREQYHEHESQSLSESIDAEIMSKFDPSRIPPGIAFQSPQARTAIGKEITDLLTPHAKVPPAMMEIDLADSKYRHLPRVISTIIAKRK